MELITKEMFDSFPVINGVKQCPQGDYSQIKVFAGFCSFAEQCSFAEWCSFAKGCSFAEGCKAVSPYWSFQYKPPFKTEGKIYPTPDSRPYWNERLKEFGLQFETECYDEIEEIITPKIPEILKSNKWTECERGILESWRAE